MSRRNILVVDDDSLIGWALQKELTNRGISTRIAATGMECLAAMRNSSFDLVFLDIHLPDANGIDLMKAIREISPETRVVIISADGSFQGKERALSEGAVQFLEKPFDMGVVVKVAESAFTEYSCKRKHWRYLCDIPLRLSVLAPSREEAQFDLESLSVRVKDVGREGVRIKTEYPLREGQGVRLRVAEGGDPFSRMIPREASAEVVWAVPGEGMSTAGLRFVAETP